MDVTSTPLEGYKLLDRTTLTEPYEFWEALRDAAPVQHFAEGLGFTVISRYEDVSRALLDPETFSSQLSAAFPGGMSTQVDSDAVKAVLADGCPYRDVLAFSDNPIHDLHRRTIRTGFTPPRVRELDKLIESIVAGLLDDIVTGEPVDYAERFAVQLPLRVIAHILGLRTDDWRAVKRWTEAQVARFGEPRDEETNLQVARDLVEQHQHLYRQIAMRREAPQDDFLTDVVRAAEEAGDISDDEIVLIFSQLIVAGAESTTSLLSSLLDQLLDDPERMAALRRDPDLITAAVEEALRIESPIKLAYRVVTKDVEMGGVSIPKGSVVLLVFGSANRDPRFWGDDAAQWNMERKDVRRHVAFGQGIHLCLGAGLARSEARISMQMLLDRTKSIARAPDAAAPKHKASLTVRVLDRLEVVLQPA